MRNRAEKYENTMLYLEYKEMYLTLFYMCAKAIEKGDVQAAEDYEKLEEAWGKVQQWYSEVI